MRNKILILLFLLSGFAKSNLLIAQKQVPAELLFKRDNFTDYAISPNGKYLAIVENHDNLNKLIFMELDQFNVVNTIDFKDNEIERIVWKNDNQVLYTFNNSICIIDIDNTLQKTISDPWYGIPEKDHFYDKKRNYVIVDPLLDNPDSILVTSYIRNQYSDIFKLNIKDGGLTEVAIGKNSKTVYWIINKKGELEYRFKQKSDKLIFEKYNQSNDKWEEFKILINGKNYELNLSRKMAVSNEIGIVEQPFNSEKLYLSSKIESDLRKIIEYDIKEQKVTKTIWEDSKFDIGDYEIYYSKLQFSKSNGDLLGLSYAANKIMNVWFNDKFRQYQEFIDKKLSKYNNQIIDWDIAEKRILIKSSSCCSSGLISIYDKEKQMIKPITYLREELNKYKLSETEVMQYPSFDDYRIDAYFNLPTIEIGDQAKIPLVIIPHDNIRDRDYNNFDPFVQFFASRGFAVLRLNFRGSAGYGEEHLLAGIENINKHRIEDIVYGVKYAVKLKNLDSSRVYIIGHGFGGYNTYMSVISNPQLFKAAIVVSAPSDMYSFIKEINWNDVVESYFWQSILGVYFYGEEYLKKISPYKYVQYINIPMKVFHGENDYEIRCNHAWLVEDLAKKYNKNIKVKTFPDKKHDLWTYDKVPMILYETVDFFNEIK